MVGDTDALRSLEAMSRFAQARHGLLVNNLANAGTPGFRPEDVDPAAFQAALRSAQDEVREGRSPELVLRDVDGIRFAGDQVMLEPSPRGDNLLFHDRTDADMERLLSDLAANTMAFRAANELIRNRYAMLAAAIRERP
ncbi:MAG: hypothetical protein U0574_07950 [Phycisphaerales bacterium]